MRGKVPPEVYPIIRHGITPAYAGKSLLLCFGRAPVEDHPRLCGEKSSFPIKQPPTSGSPPPMRGKVKRFNVMLGTRRDHPRLCGEKALLYTVYTVLQGITPAYAGKSCHLRRWR